MSNVALDQIAYQNAVLQELNLVGDSAAVGLAPVYWAMYPYAPSDLARYLYIKKRLLLYKMAGIAGIVDTVIAFDEIAGSQWFKALKALLDDLDNELAQVDPGINAGNFNSISTYSSLPDSQNFLCQADRTVELIYNSIYCGSLNSNEYC